MGKKMQLWLLKRREKKRREIDRRAHPLVRETPYGLWVLADYSYLLHFPGAYRIATNSIVKLHAISPGSGEPLSLGPTDQYFRRMGKIGPGEAYDCPVPSAKQIGDPSRRWDSLLQALAIA